MRKTQIAKIGVFIIGLLLIWYWLVYVLERPQDEQWDRSGLKYVYSNPDYYDVIFLGTSISITNISNEELYLRYGIAGVTIGEPQQAVYLSYYSLEEALKYQTPVAVVFDVKALFYTEDELVEFLKESEYQNLHYSLDNMKIGIAKYNAFCQAKEILPELDYWNYFSKTYYNHANWENMVKDNFNRVNSKMIMNGNLMLLNIPEYTNDMLEQEYTDEKAEIPDINLEYLYKMVELCDEKDIPLILARGGGVFSWKEYNAMQEIAEELQLPYLDLSNYEEDVGINLRIDSADGNHFNVVGAQKWTRVLGDYLSERFSFVDRRKDARYDNYKEKEHFYSELIRIMNNQIALVNSLNFESYLQNLQKLDYSDTTVFIAVKDEASASLTYNEIWLLNEIGLSAEIFEKYQYSYIGIIGEAGYQELVSEDLIIREGKIGESTNYMVTSGGYNAGNLASIVINGTEMAPGGRGINIVVYNSTIDQVISSVYFDTYQYENPPTSRISMVREEQYEFNGNVWKPIGAYQSGEIQ